jgi:hypothetical protein
MAGRNQLVYDEDDYLPPGYVPPRPAAGRTKLFVGVIIGCLILGAFVVIALTRSRDRARYARMEMNRAQQMAVDGSRFSTRRSMGGAVAEEPGIDTNLLWNHLFGTWSRTPQPGIASTYPHRLHFRRNLGDATITRFDPNNGREIEKEASITLRAQPDNTYSMDVKFIENGVVVTHTYPFRMTPEQTLVMHDETGGLVFTREN